MSTVQQHLFGPTPEAAQSQWFTPDWLADRAVDWAIGDRFGQARVVELGAGDGAFVRPLVRAGARVVAVERDPRYTAVLRSLAESWPMLTVIEHDALTLPLQRDNFDLYVGNPPYEDDADIAFVERGLELAPRVVAVLRLVFLAGETRYRRIWAKHHLARIAYLPGRPSFIGEKSDTAKADFAVFDIRRGHAASGYRDTRAEWWVR